MKLNYILCMFFLFLSQNVLAFYDAPVVVPASSIKMAAGFSIKGYQLFKSNRSGEAIPIPFQIDERDEWGDYVLDKGKNPSSMYGNLLFDGEDELAFMGRDVGPVNFPVKWSFPKPLALFEIKLSKNGEEFAVYLGVYRNQFQHPIVKNHVFFNEKDGEVRSSKFLYQFDKKNQLVVRGIDIVDQEKRYPLILSSTLFMRADLKYLPTIDLNHSDIDSEFDAYKEGMIRTITRVNFTYSLLTLKIQLGMYTEVSFFENAVELPAIIENPLDGGKILNTGSHFYYGFALKDNPQDLKLASNMPEYSDLKSILTWPVLQKIDGDFWVSALGQNYSIYILFVPSLQMKQSKNYPMIYTEKTEGVELNKRTKSAIVLGKSPVNVAVAFRLNPLSKGVHAVKFRIYVENKKDEALLEQFKSIPEWKTGVKRVAL